MVRRLRRLVPSGRRGKQLLAALSLIVVVAVVVIVVLGTRKPSANADAGSQNASSGATSVQRRNLVETDTESGTLSYSSSQTVYDRLTGTITWLPQVGQVIKPGGALYRVDGKPVILMNGNTPAYRDLTPDDTDGADITELNRNLVRLGFNADAIVVDDIWQPATTYGVELLQESLDEDATGSLTLGQVVFLPGDQLVSAVDTTAGSTGAGGSGSSGNAFDDTVVDPSQPEFVSLTKPKQSTTTPTTATTTTTSTTPASSPNPTSAHKHKGSHSKSKHSSNPSTESLQALLQSLRAQTQALQAAAAALRAAQSAGHNSGGANKSHNSSKSGSSSSSGSSNSSSNSGSSDSGSSNSSGSSGATAQAVLQTTSTHLVVTVDLAASSQSEAVVGEHVTVELPNGDTVPGKITAVSPVAQSSSGSGNGSGGSGSGSGNGNGSGNGSGNGNSSSSTIPVTISLKGHHTGAGLDQAAVSVNFVEARAKNVLSVPVTALLATAGGNYAVQEAAAPHHLIPVTTGLFAAGYVEVSGAGIYPGLAVTDSQG